MNIRKEIIQRITITGPMEENYKALDEHFHPGDRLVKSGPMPVGKFKIDPTRFKLIIDRKIS